jgi:ADP-ribosylglycohydrolase
MDITGYRNRMLGAIAGDVIGSVHEFLQNKTTDFPLFVEHTRFTDDSVLTLAVAECLLTGASYVDKFHEYTNAYPDRCYGGGFHRWALRGDREPYNSWGNGSAMRVSPVGWAFDSLDETLTEATRSAAVTHNHPEGIKGAQATAATVFLARKGESKDAIRAFVTERFGYDLDRTVEGIRPDYEFNESCQGTVPEALIAFFDSTDYENAIRLAISLGGDADTLACITGGIAEAFYGGVPEAIAARTIALLDEPLQRVLAAFHERYPVDRRAK